MKPYESKVASYTGDGNAKVLSLGFNPSYFKLVNITDRIIEEKYSSMAAADYLHTVAAGTNTNPADSAVTFPGDGTVSIAAGTNINAKVYHYLAIY